MRNRELFRKLALACASATLLLAAVAPGSQAAVSTVVTAASPAPSPSPSPSPTPKHKNHTVTNPAPPGPGASQPGVRPLAPQSRLHSALAAAGLAAPASSLAPSTCTLSTTAALCELWATTGTLSVPGALPLPVWGFSSSPTPGTAQVPGPILIANAGESISIRVHNALPDPNGNNTLSIEVPASSARTDLNGIDPGEVHTYDFGSLGPGTFLYEAGPTANGARQVRMGLAGVLVVRPSNFATCNCAYGGGVTDSFVDESTLLLNEFDPTFNGDPFGFDPVEFTPSLFTINGHAFDNSGVGAVNKINVVSGDVVLFHYANLSEHERGITIANERQTILADDSYVLKNPLNVATKWLNPGQVSDSFVTIDPSFPPSTHIPVYDAGLHLSNNGDLGLGGMFTYLDVIQGLAGSVNGPVTTAALNAPTNSGIENLTVTGTITPSAGTTLTDAEWFLDNPGAPGTGPTCPAGGLTITSNGSAYTSPFVTISGGGTGATGATATVSGSMDAINVKTGGAGYTTPTVSISGGAATAFGSVDAVKPGTPGIHYTTPAVGFSGGGGSGAAATTTGPVDGVTMGTLGAGYTTPSVGFSGGGGSSATASVTGSVDGVKLTTNGAGYTAPVLSLIGGGATTGATISISGSVDGFKIVNAGSGYKAPTVGFIGGGGINAAANALFDATTGAITGFTITNPGTGYTSAPTVTITDTTPGVVGGANINSTISVAVISLGAGGLGYSSAPTIGFADSAGGTGAGAAAKATISVTAIALGAGGTLYSSHPDVAINDTGVPATLATATSTIGVTGFVLGSGGSAYTTAPLVKITDAVSGAGTNATATATLTIKTITVNTGGAGSGYNPAPTVTITDAGGTGSGATATSTLTLNAITLTNPGHGYRTPPTVTIGDNAATGTGAAAMASLPATLCIYQHLTVSPTGGSFTFTIPSADLNFLLLTALNRDGDHIIWVHAQDSNGTWGVVAGDVFTYNATGPVVGALSVHSSPTNGFRPTDVANGGGPVITVNGAPVAQNAPSNDLVVLGMAAASLSNFVVTGAEYCIDTMGCPPLPNTANPNGPTALVLTPGGSGASGPIDAQGNPLVTPIACMPLTTAPGVTPPSLPAPPGGGSIVSFCGTVPQDTLKSLSEGPHTLYIHACEQLSSTTTPCATTPRWGAYSTEAAIQFVIDRHGPTASSLSLDSSPNNGRVANQGNLNFLDSIQLAATLSDASTGNSNIAYAEVFVTCSPALQASCQSVNGPIDPVTKAAPADGSGAEMVPSGAAWDAPIKLAYAYIPLAVLTEYHEGKVRFWIHGQDQAGNFGPWAWADLIYDTTSPVFDTPVIPAPPAPPTSIACTTGCTINFTAHDPASGGVNSNIVQAEWFIDQGAQVICEANVPGCTPEVAVLSDPGYGSATPIAIPTPLTTSVAGQLVLTAQPAGTKIVFRVKDAAGNWSLDNLVVTT